MNVYPALQGLRFPVGRKPIFKTIKQESMSGRVVTATYMQNPLFEYTLAYDYLSPADMDLLMGFFLQQGGDLTPFWFDAGPGDDAVTEEGIGTGDGVTTDFQLFQSSLGFALPVSSSFGTRTAYSAGVAAAATFETPSPGWVRYSVAPPNGAALKWSGNYYQQCRFKQPSIEIVEFANLMYEAQQVQLRTYF